MGKCEREAWVKFILRGVSLKIFIVIFISFFPRFYYDFFFRKGLDRDGKDGETCGNGSVHNNDYVEGTITIEVVIAMISMISYQ